MNKMVALIEVARERVDRTRTRRCGGTVWLPPPDGWGLAVQAAWPEVYFKTPFLPDGWVDLLLAMSEHVHEVLHNVHIVDIFQNAMTGHLQVRSAGPGGLIFDEVTDAIDAYEYLSASTCVECGADGHCRTIGEKSFRLQVLCDAHAGGRA